MKANANPTAMHASTREYVASESIARDYDRYFAEQALFATDTAILDEWLRGHRRVLDLGCGTGRHLCHFAGQGYEMVGVDLSAAMLAEARRKLAQARLQATLIEADFLTLDQADEHALARGSFDAAICMFSTVGLIYGHAHRVAFLQMVRGLLQPEGVLALHVHNYGCNLWRHEGRVFMLTNLMRAAWGRDEIGDKFMGHYRGVRRMYIHVFRRRELRRLLAEAGFEIVEMTPLNLTRTARLRWPRWASILASGYLLRARPTTQ